MKQTICYVLVNIKNNTFFSEVGDSNSITNAVFFHEVSHAELAMRSFPEMYIIKQAKISWED